ncbi:hypothetical protein ACQ4PT_027159 [Festuca glaucescens]
MSSPLPVFSARASTALTCFSASSPHPYPPYSQYYLGGGGLGLRVDPRSTAPSSSLAKAAKHTTPSWERFLAVISAMVQEVDKSWLVRYMVANQLYELCEAVGPEPTRADLVTAYVRLLRDNEGEVRIAAAGKVTKFCRILTPQLAIEHILPCANLCQLYLQELSSDSSQYSLVKLQDLETNVIVLFHGGGFGSWCSYKTMSVVEDSGFKVNTMVLMYWKMEFHAKLRIEGLPEEAREPQAVNLVLAGLEGVLDEMLPATDLWL